MTKRNPEETRTRLLDAASHIIVEQGLDGFTLDSVAHAAGVSKGGLLHHFASKEILIAELVEHALTTFEADLEQHLDPSEPEGTPGRWTRAYIRLSFAQDQHSRDLSVAHALVTRRDPDLVARVGECYSRIGDALIHDGLDPVQSALLRSAADGVFYNETLGYPPLDEGLREALFQQLLTMTTSLASAGLAAS